MFSIWAVLKFVQDVRTAIGEDVISAKIAESEPGSCLALELKIDYDNEEHGTTVNFVSGTTQEDVRGDNKSFIKVPHVLPTH